MKKYVQWYCYRWLIERYHYVLKSGCGIEKLQLETVQRLEILSLDILIQTVYFVSIQLSPARTSTTKGTLKPTAFSIIDLICGCNSSHS